MIKQILVFVILGMVINCAISVCHINYLSNFIDGNLLLILIALMAINTTTTSVILTKIKEIKDMHPQSDFERTVKSMKNATKEQLVLILLTIVLQSLKGYSNLNAVIPGGIFIADSMLIGILASGIFILYDTAQGVYVILDNGF